MSEDNGTDYMSNNEMVITQSGGKRFTGGYQLNNLFKDNNVGPYSYVQSGGSGELLMASMFKDLAVPTSLLYLQHKYKAKNIGKNSEDARTIPVMKEDMYSKLIDLVTPGRSSEKKSKKHTRKQKRSTKKRTRKQR
jgi:hypothetical protein